MEKIQILFPEPQLARLRQAAKLMDRPVSELVCSAVDAWLEANAPAPAPVPEAPPVYGLGEMSRCELALGKTVQSRSW